MTLGFAHELGMAIATLSALAIVLLGGELPVVAWLALGAPVVSALLRAKGRAAPASAGTLMALASLALGFAQIAVNGLEFAVLGGGIALVGILCARLLTRTTADHDLQSILIALLLVFAGSVLNVSLSFGPVFVLFSISAVWALTTRQLLRGGALEAGASDDGVVDEALRSRTDVVTPMFFAVSGGISLVILLGTGLVFVAFPRVGLANFGVQSQRKMEFPGAVSLRGSPRAAVGSSATVARVSDVPVGAFNQGLYLRGGVYDTVDTVGFSRSDNLQKPPARLQRIAPGPFEADYEIFLNPLGEDLLLSLGSVRGVRALGGGQNNPNFKLPVSGLNARGELSATRRLTSAIRYRVQGGISAPGFVGRRVEFHSPEDAEDALLPYLALPPGLDPRLDELARSLVGEERRPDEVAARIRAHLLTNFSYTLSQPAGSAAEPLVAFLLEHKSGHCEYFATAFALLLRLRGIPARVVGGYQGGAWDAEDELVVFTGRNAHAWVEWYAPEVGWVLDDATPAPTAPREQLEGTLALLDRIQRFWDDRVLDYALDQQIDALKGTRSAFARLAESGDLKSVVLVIVLVGVLVFAVVLLRRLRPRDKGPASDGERLALAIATAIAELTGRVVDDSATFREAQRSLSPCPPAITAATRLYERHRFGGEALPASELERALGELEALTAAVTPSPPGAIEKAP